MFYDCFGEKPFLQQKKSSKFENMPKNYLNKFIWTKLPIKDN